MATHSSIRGWEIPWTEETGGLQSMGSQRVSHDLAIKQQHAKLLQSCLTLCDPTDSSLPVSSVHGILQARILEWVAMPSSRGSFWPRDRTHFCLLHWQVGSLPLAPPGGPPNSGPHRNSPSQHGPRVYRRLQLDVQESHHSHWLRLQIPSFYLYLKHWISQEGDKPVFYYSLTPSWPAPFNPLSPVVSIPSSARPSLSSPSNSGAS